MFAGCAMQHDPMPLRRTRSACRTPISHAQFRLVESDRWNPADPFEPQRNLLMRGPPVEFACKIGEIQGIRIPVVRNVAGGGNERCRLRLRCPAW